METKWLVPELEDFASAFVEVPRNHKVIYSGPSHEAGVQGKKGIRPKFSGVVLGVDFSFQIRGPNGAEGTRKMLVGADQLMIEFKCLHGYQKFLHRVACPVEVVQPEC